MTFSISKHKDKLLFVPLGGANEIGMNMNLYHYKGKWIIADLGIGFCDKDLPGVDVILPKIDFIEEYKDDILGMVLTHAHEDHIGGIPYLWQYLGCPLYATKFTAEVIRSKLSEFDQDCDAPLHEVSTGDVIDLDPFSVQLYHITHSIPEMNGLMIRTDAGNIFHSGDYCLDHNPGEGDATDEDKLKQLGDEGVLAFVGDSTNIFTEGTSGSEGDLGESIKDLVSSMKRGMTIVTTFASNIARLRSIAVAAQSQGKKVSLAGRALWRMYNAARASGYLENIDAFIPTNEISKYNRDEILVICTGCQGEILAATSKMAIGEHPDIKLQKGDSIIFSSKIIPGNEKRISSLLNSFSKMGVEVLTERDYFVHVSGHPARDEVKRMYELLRPQIAIPVHGEAYHLHEHCKFATEHCNVPASIEVTNGVVVNICKEGAGIIGEVDSGYLAIDGSDIIDEDSIIFRERRGMRDSGYITVFLIQNASGNLIRKPRIIASGIFDRSIEEDKNTMDSMSDEVRQIISSNKKKERKELTKSISRSLERMCYQIRGKRPKVFVYIETLS